MYLDFGSFAEMVCAMSFPLQRCSHDVLPAVWTCVERNDLMHEIQKSFALDASQHDAFSEHVGEAFPLRDVSHVCV